MTVLRWFVGSWLSRIYLLVVATYSVWTAVSLARWGQPYADLEVMCLMLITAPVSWALLTAVERWDGNTGVFCGCIAAAALVNAAALNGMAALIRRTFT
jgi:hypothetical protein